MLWYQQKKWQANMSVQINIDGKEYNIEDAFWLYLSLNVMFGNRSIPPQSQLDFPILADQSQHINWTRSIPIQGGDK